MARNKKLNIIGLFVMGLLIININVVLNVAAEDQTVYQGIVTEASYDALGTGELIGTYMENAGIEKIFYSPPGFHSTPLEDFLELLATKVKTSTYTSSSQLWEFTGYGEGYVEQLESSSNSIETTANDGDEVLLTYGTSGSGSDSFSIPVSGELEPILPEDEEEITTTKILNFWFNIGHSVTLADEYDWGIDGAPCFGLKSERYLPAGVDPVAEEKINYTDMYDLEGLEDTFVFINSCNSFMGPWKNAILSNNPAAYIGGNICLPAYTSNRLCEFFWQEYFSEYAQGNPSTNFDDSNFQTFIDDTLEYARNEANNYASHNDRIYEGDYGVWVS